MDICRDVFGRGDSFVQKIIGRVDRPLQRIREFRNRSNPGIVVTVDMLSTGVDIKEGLILLDKVLGRLATSKKGTIVIKRPFDGKKRVTSNSWDGGSSFPRPSARSRECRQPIACCEEGCRPDEWDPPCEPYDPYGPGEDPITEKVANEVLKRFAPERATHRPAEATHRPDDE